MKEEDEKVLKEHINPSPETTPENETEETTGGKEETIEEFRVENGLDPIEVQLREEFVFIKAQIIVTFEVSEIEKVESEETNIAKNRGR